MVKKGGIDTWSTYSNANIQDLRREIDQLCVEDYNLVINDFEPVSAWACRKRNIPVIGLSHQGSLLNNNVPLPDKHDHIGRLILKKYAPASTHIGFHFRIYDQNIFTPVIRRQVREARTQELDYYTVYLPAYNDERIVKKLSVFENVNWHVFSKHSKRVCQEGNILIKPIADDEFVADMSKSKGVLCGAGFETPAEALFLHKKLMVIPIKGQYEQQCNAAALEELGVPVIKNLKRKNFKKMQTWLDTDDKIEVNYPDHTRMVLRRLFEMYVQIYSERNINKNKRVS